VVDSWANSGVDLHLDLDRGGRRVRASLERELRNAVRKGRLQPGAVLPPSRSFAADLGVARNTVAEAYAQLIAEGWLVARQGSGNRVADRPHGAQHTASRARPPRAASRRYDLRAGFPDLTSFPRNEWLAAARSALAIAPDAALGYGPPGGQPALRTALDEYLGRARGVQTSPDRVVVCAGFTAGLRMLATVLRAQGVRRVGVERYGHGRHRRALTDAGLIPVPLEVDAAGAVPAGLTGLGAVLLTSAHQFPLGVALSAARRAEFTRWAVRAGALIIEDDYDGEFRYDRRSLGAVQALAPQHVVYAGTASKTIAPGLRLGWLAVPDRLHPALLEIQTDSNAQPAAIEQLTLAQFITSGRYDRHVRRARLHYKRRRERLTAGLARRAPAFTLSGMDAGLHATLDLPPGADEPDLVARAAARDLAVEGLAAFDACNDSDRRGLVIGYGTPAPRAYTTAIARLFATLAE
jgi:GntR family transcriptional regulator / MocR family aminotransferase